MISFEQDDKQFNHRVVGVTIHDGKVLLHRAEWEAFWSLPGGRVELLEPSPDALRREMQEEIGEAVEVGRLLWVAENFFHYNGKGYHELGLYFLVTLPDASPLLQTPTFDGREEGMRLLFQWFPLDTLHTLFLYPTFLRTALGTLPAIPIHIVHFDSELPPDPTA